MKIWYLGSQNTTEIKYHACHNQVHVGAHPFFVAVITELSLQSVALPVEVANKRKGSMKTVMSTRLGLVHTACHLQFRLCFGVY